MLEHEARQIERDRARTISAQEGEPIRTASYLFPSVTGAADRFVVSLEPGGSTLLTRVQAERLADRLQEALSRRHDGGGRFDVV